MRRLKVKSYWLQQGDHEAGRREVTLDCAIQRDGSEKWVIRSEGDVLNKRGRWVWDGLNSSRTEKFIAETRFDSREDALTAWDGEGVS